jgi:leader peptidase (prepilin peptidase)/N-methyltransferase
MAGAVLWSSFAALLAVVTVSDLRTRRIPDRVVIAAAAIVVLTLAVSAPAALGGRLLAASAAGAFLLAAAVANPAGMGLGDVKLAVVLGLYLGRDPVRPLPRNRRCGRAGDRR